MLFLILCINTQATTLSYVLFIYKNKPMELTSATRRVFMSVSSKSPLFTTAWEDPEAVVQAALKLLQESNLYPNTSDAAPNPRLLVVERSSRIYLAFDIFHESYDPKTAHFPRRNDLPTLAVFFYGKEKFDIRDATAAESKLREEVNKQVQSFHDWTGIGSLLLAWTMPMAKCRLIGILERGRGL